MYTYFHQWKVRTISRNKELLSAPRSLELCLSEFVSLPPVTEKHPQNYFTSDRVPTQNMQNDLTQPTRMQTLLVNGLFIGSNVSLGGMREPMARIWAGTAEDAKKNAWQTKCKIANSTVVVSFSAFPRPSSKKLDKKQQVRFLCSTHASLLSGTILV